MIIVIPGDKDSSIMEKNDYDNKMQEMIDKGIQDGVTPQTTPYKIKSIFRTFCIETLVNTKNIMIH